MLRCGYYLSPLGPLLLAAEGEALAGLWMNRRIPEDVALCTDGVLADAASWLDDYFLGNPRMIDFPLSPGGTPFQRMVWNRLLEIPFGSTDTYGNIAREIGIVLGKEKMSAQAVGQAVGKNPISIIIPCHRVVGARGKLTGYAGGLDKKIWLLNHEGGREI